MDDSEWHEVTRKNRRSMFERLNPSKTQKSNVDELAKISLSVYVSNFPSHLTVRELWNICSKMGTLVDVYIAKRKNKLGHMFTFCRYIKVTNSNALVDSLSNVWIGKLRLHANVARFDRNTTVKSSYANEKVVTPKAASSNRIYSFSNANSYAFVAKKPLDNDKMGPDSVNNERGDVTLHDDFVVEERLIWLEIEGVPIRAWEHGTFKSIYNKWGDMHFCGDSNKCNRDLCSWTPNFVWEKSDSDEENYIGNFNQDKEGRTSIRKNLLYVLMYLLTVILLDYSLLSIRQETNESMVSKFPPGYSLNVTNFQQDTLPDCNANQPLASESISLGDSHKKVSFSLLERLKEMIKVRVALGLNMEGCESTLAALIDNNGDHKETKLVHVDLWMIQQVWGNSYFDFASMSVRGFWIPNNARIMWIAVYAPQDLSCKISLWSALDDLVTKWDGVLVAMRDFNELREAGERFGSSFNERQSNVFNSFISNASLIDVPLGGYKFTWTDKWGSKMSKHDRKEHSSRLSLIDQTIDQGLANEMDISNRRDSIRIMGELNKPQASDVAQKAKIKWVMEGDENSNFFHATLKKNRRQLSIKGIQKDGVWISKTYLIKKEFKTHFQNRFQLPRGFPTTFVTAMNDYLSQDQVEFLECDIT
nr:RNA-directed DNA polymerase, eukaryota, reverse transcriptase zinc-binding domain protein [Tanacetum cinerariifolium]